MLKQVEIMHEKNKMIAELKKLLTSDILTLALTGLDYINGNTNESKATGNIQIKADVIHYEANHSSMRTITMKEFEYGMEIWFSINNCRFKKIIVCDKENTFPKVIISLIPNVFLPSYNSDIECKSIFWLPVEQIKAYLFYKYAYIESLYKDVEL